MSTPSASARPQIFGHPTGLFSLFFAEMWERFSYYGMRALLIFYMTKGFLGYNDTKAYSVYGAYTAMVYMTPYFGGILADRVIGARRAVVIGGLLMAAGHLLMTIETTVAFFGALALLIVGNGFFKPNISTMVGGLYDRDPGRRDAGFTLFYMGINLGAAMAPILCGYVGETYGWHYGFGLATLGMLIGVAVFAAPTRLTQGLILVGALGTSLAMPFLQESALQLAVRILLAVALTGAGVVAFLALGRGGLPDDAGAPKDPAVAKRYALAVYGGSLGAVGLFALVFFEVSIASYILGGTGLLALAYILVEAVRAPKIERERLGVVLVLMFFSVAFWAFFEQAGSSMANFTDRNVDRVFETDEVGPDRIGTDLTFRVRANDEARAELPLLSQEQLGLVNDDPAMKDRIVAGVRRVEAEKAAKKGVAVDEAEVDALVAQVRAEPRLTMTGLTVLRDVAAADDAPPESKAVTWRVRDDNVGMKLGTAEVPAAEFQAANPIFILLFGLAFSALWGFLAARRLEPSTPVKFGLGLVQLGLGFGALWYGAQQADPRGAVAMSWLLLGYLLHTTGELCLSPVGLSMVTKLSPPRIVSTMMGAWFLFTAFSNLLAGIIATFTGGGGHGSEGGLALIPAPQDSLPVYAEVFGAIGVAAVAAGLVCFLLSPLLTRWMHLEAFEDGHVS
ncbi:MAG: oligopeptide:H+ symporter [Myxococcota bacterium]